MSIFHSSDLDELEDDLEKSDESLANSHVYTQIKNYPWFHGTLNRTLAARLVLKEGMAS